MVNQTDPKERKSQRSISLCQRQFLFLEANPSFQLDEFVRQVLDLEITKMGQFQFLQHKSLFPDEEVKE